jgi:hypothetical protein
MLAGQLARSASQVPGRKTDLAGLVAIAVAAYPNVTATRLYGGQSALTYLVTTTVDGRRAVHKTPSDRPGSRDWEHAEADWIAAHRPAWISGEPEGEEIAVESAEYSAHRLRVAAHGYSRVSCLSFKGEEGQPVSSGLGLLCEVSATPLGWNGPPYA